MKSTLTICLLTVLVACSSTTAKQTTPVQASSVATGVVTGFTADINAFRAGQGLDPLQPNTALTRAAQRHADDMSVRGYFSHASPGGPDGDNFAERARASGCAMRNGAENIATGQQTEGAALVAWQNSAGHRRNMLVRNYTQYGLGRAGDLWVLKLAASC
jgi:uncharacterized protein YkwD